MRMTSPFTHHALQSRSDLSGQGRQGLALGGDHGGATLGIGRERDVRSPEQQRLVALHQAPGRLQQALALPGHVEPGDVPGPDQIYYIIEKLNAGKGLGILASRMHHTATQSRTPILSPVFARLAQHLTDASDGARLIAKCDGSPPARLLIGSKRRSENLPPWVHNVREFHGYSETPGDRTWQRSPTMT